MQGPTITEPGLRKGETPLARLLLQEDLNFLLTNRVPRIALSRLAGWYSRIRSERLTRVSLAVWRLFTEVDLSDARERRFHSLQAVFTRALRDGARPIDTDPAVLVSPCDAIVGACGTVREGMVWQCKGLDYRAADLLVHAERAAAFEGGRFVTLRLTSAMYHRFHAPHDATLERVSTVAGDRWNVNPIALARIERLFCRNERALLRFRLGDGTPLALVPVAAILVGGIRLHEPDLLLHPRNGGRAEIPCDRRVVKGEELGWFEHGSTIIVFVAPGYELAPTVVEGATMRMGQALLRRCA